MLDRSLAAKAVGPSSAPDLCAILFSGSCDHALADPRSWFLGLPLAGWGLVYFSTLAGLLLLARFVEGSFELHARIAASALAVLGVSAGVALTTVSLLSRLPLCPLCVGVHALDVALLAALQRLVGLPVHEQLRTLREGMLRLLRRSEPPEATRWPLVGFTTVALISLLAHQWVLVEAAIRRTPAARNEDPAQVLAAHLASPLREISLSPDDPHLGPLDAPVQLVVFESFRCAHCRRFEPTLSALRRRFGDALLIAFKHYPLSSACNDRLGRDLQPGACELAWAAEAAHRQARFWPFHDALLASEPDLTTDELTGIARTCGLDTDRFESDRRSAAVRQRVAEDVVLGNRLALPGTPATFLDGRLVRSPSLARLELLIRHELGRKSAGATSGVPAERKRDRSEDAGRPSSGG